MGWRARIHTGDRVFHSSLLLPPFPSAAALSLQYSARIWADYDARVCLRRSVIARSAKCCSDLQLPPSRRGMSRRVGKKNDTTRFMHYSLPLPFPSLSSLWASLPIFSSEPLVSLQRVWGWHGLERWQRLQGGEKKKVREVPECSISKYTCTLAHLHVSTPQISNKGRPAARQLWAQQLRGYETQKPTSSVTSTDGGETRGSSLRHLWEEQTDVAVGGGKQRRRKRR